MLCEEVAELVRRDGFVVDQLPRRPVDERALQAGVLAADHLEHHPHGHSGREGVGVDEHVGHDAAVGEGQVGRRHVERKRPLLPVARAELVADDRVALQAKDQHCVRDISAVVRRRDDGVDPAGLALVEAVPGHHVVVQVLDGAVAVGHLARDAVNRGRLREGRGAVVLRHVAADFRRRAAADRQPVDAERRTHAGAVAANVVEDGDDFGVGVADCLVGGRRRDALAQRLIHGKHAALHGVPVQDERVLHVHARVRRDGQHGVHVHIVLIETVLVHGPRAHDAALEVGLVVQLRVVAERRGVVRWPDGLLCDTALEKVSGTAVVLEEGDHRRRDGQQVRAVGLNEVEDVRRLGPGIAEIGVHGSDV
eukprot:PhM_4_TR2645/c0_g1_i1/m.76426